MVERLSVETFCHRHESLPWLWKKYALPSQKLPSPEHPTAWWAFSNVWGLYESSLLFFILLFSSVKAEAHRRTAPKGELVTLWWDRAEQCGRREELLWRSMTSLDKPEIYLEPGTPFYVFVTSNSKIWQHSGVVVNHLTPVWIWILVGH